MELHHVTEVYIAQGEAPSVLGNCLDAARVLKLLNHVIASYYKQIYKE